MSWKDIIKNYQINIVDEKRYSVKTTPPLQGYKPPTGRGFMTGSAQEAFLHLKDFVEYSRDTRDTHRRGNQELNISLTQGTQQNPKKGIITSTDGKQVAEFEIIRTK